MLLYNLINSFTQASLVKLPFLPFTICILATVSIKMLFAADSFKAIIFPLIFSKSSINKYGYSLAL